MSTVYNVIGLMSGTSLDGVDVVWVKFTLNDVISYDIKKAVTVPYDKCQLSKLILAEQVNTLDFLALHNEYGRYLGNIVNQLFTPEEKRQIDFIASHGHTIFHQPDKKITFQLGHGASIAAQTGIDVINDFRVLDVALGGQGAPLVPVGDELLFNAYDYCLNIGGIANVSYKDDRQNRTAFDISVANMALNDLASELNLPYDKNGNVARNGRLNIQLLEELNRLDYYHQFKPKSLGKEWYLELFKPVVVQFNIAIEDKLHTVTEHIAFQVGKVLNKAASTTLVTGGGAFNTYLTERIQHYAKSELVIPEKELIMFKEALIFAFLGVLYMENKTNCLSSVTGAEVDNIGGCLWKMS